MISPDLTRHDPKTLGASGGPITKDQTSVEYYGDDLRLRRVAGAEGRDLGGHRTTAWCTCTRDNGKTWKNVTPKDMAKYTRVSIIEPSPLLAGHGVRRGEPLSSSTT